MNEILKLAYKEYKSKGFILNKSVKHQKFTSRTGQLIERTNEAWEDNATGYVGVIPPSIIIVDNDKYEESNEFDKLLKDLNLSYVPEPFAYTPSGGEHYAFINPYEDMVIGKHGYKAVDIYSGYQSVIPIVGTTAKSKTEKGKLVEYTWADELEDAIILNPFESQMLDIFQMRERSEKGNGYKDIDEDEHFMTRPPKQEIQEWLNKIDPSSEYDTWVDTIRALNSWDLGGEEGLELAIEWSQKAENCDTIDEITKKYNANQASTPEFYKKLIGLVNTKSKFDFNLKIKKAGTEEELLEIADEISESSISNIDRTSYVDKLCDKNKELGNKPERVTFKKAVAKKVEKTVSDNLKSLPDFYYNEKGFPVFKNTLDNLCAFVKNVSELTIKYDVILKRVIINNTYEVGDSITQEEAYSILFSELTKKNVGTPSTMLSQHFSSMVFRNKVNPLLTFVEELPKWDGETDYIGRVAESITTEVASKEYKHEVMKCFSIQAIASWDGRKRSSHPLSRLDSVMTFIGKQGAGKTTWFNKLMPDFMGYYFKDGVELDPSNKDSYIEATQAGLVELGELDATNRKSDISSLKAFLSRTVDEFRAPYGRASERYARQTVFVGTVNNSDFLKDATGSRRFMVLDAVNVVMPSTEDVLGMWSQALALYLEGENWLLSSEWQEVRNQINKGYTDLGNVGDLASEIIEANDRGTGKIVQLRLKAIADKFKYPIRNNRERSDLAEYLINHGVKKHGNGKFAVKEDIFDVYNQMKVEHEFGSIEDEDEF